MSDPFDLDAIPGEEDSGAVAAPETPAPEASTESAEAPVAETPNYVALDAIIPDSEDIDEEYRGKPIADLLRVAKQHKDEVKGAYERNQKAKDIEFENRTLRAILQQNQRAQTPLETDEQLLSRLSQSPTQVLPEIINQYVAPLQQELEQTRFGIVNMQAELARERARSAMNIPAETWEQIRAPLASVLQARGWPVDDPQAWAAAANEFRQAAQAFAPRPTTVQRPASPPAGQARSTTTGITKPRLSARNQETLADTADVFGIKPGTTAYEELEAALAGAR